MSKLSDRLTSRAEELDISQTKLAEIVGISQASISDVFTGVVASPRKWREIAAALGIPESEMRELMQEAIVESGKTARIPRALSKDASFAYSVGTPASPPPGPGAMVPVPNATIDQGPVSIVSGKPPRMLPVLGEAAGGVDGQYLFNGNVLDWVACPPSLVNVPNAYAVWIDGDSMYPRFKSGELVYVHPGKPARRGDDVLVQVKPSEEDMPPRGFVKELVGYQGDRLLLKQFNPADVRIEFPKDDVISIHPITFAGKY